jgi:hypothetical protein
MDQNEMSNLYRGPSIDASYKAFKPDPFWSHLEQVECEPMVSVYLRYK